MRHVILFALLATLLVGAMAMPLPQYLEEAVRQAQAMQLLPPYAVVDKTAPGIQVSISTKNAQFLLPMFYHSPFPWNLST